MHKLLLVALATLALPAIAQEPPTEVEIPPEVAAAIEAAQEPEVILPHLNEEALMQYLKVAEILQQMGVPSDDQ